MQDAINNEQLTEKYAAVMDRIVYKKDYDIAIKQLQYRHF
jgi:hypothetical protein